MRICVAAAKWLRRANKFSDEPFAKVHYDLWGPSPVLSFQRFQYYVIFIDECARFTWFYPLKQKSDFTQCFINFHNYVNTQFEKNIRVFQSDGGGEFIGHQFQNYLLDNGIVHQMSCPYTPKQNGMQSPYERLLGTKPDYGSFRVFGTRCYPCLCDYAKDKFDARSLPCLFLGYSHQFKGYHCLYPPTNRIYISRHVVFDEVTYPFRDPGALHSSTETPLDLAVFTDWLSGSDACEPLSCEPLSSEESNFQHHMSAGNSKLPMNLLFFMFHHVPQLMGSILYSLLFPPDPTLLI